MLGSFRLELRHKDNNKYACVLWAVPAFVQSLAVMSFFYGASVNTCRLPLLSSPQLCPTFSAVNVLFNARARTQALLLNVFCAMLTY